MRLNLLGLGTDDKKSGVAKVDDVIGQFQEMQAQLSEGRDEIADDIDACEEQLKQLQHELSSLVSKDTQAKNLEEGLRKLTNGSS